jgi:transposase InsO family protein
MERGPALSDPRPGLDLQCYRHPPVTSHGYPRRTIAAELTVAERILERLIGTIRRECVGHMIVFGEAHLRRTLGEFATYYNNVRVHQSLNKDAPLHRPIERLGAITSRPTLGGLHHQYCRI